MKLVHPIRTILAPALLAQMTFSTCAQLAITEVMSSGSTNAGPQQVIQNSDFWELTNFGAEAIDLTGYKFDDDSFNFAAADTAPFLGLSIGPGESILFVQNNVNMDEASFRAWWGAEVSESVKIAFYSGNGMSSGGDGVRLWGPNALNAEDYVDSVDFTEATRGVTFTYDPETGEFAVLSMDGVNGAFKAETTDDIGSPGTSPGPAPLKIVAQPLELIVNPGDPANFSVTVTGRPRGRYQWFRNGNAIPGATQATLEIPDVQTPSTGSYTVTIDNGVETITSAPAELVLQTEASAPVFTQTPSDLTMTVGQLFTFAASASGVPQPTYQWQKDGQNIDGAVGEQFILFAASTDQDSGEYAVIARNAVGSVTHTFGVTVTQKPRLVITEVMSSELTEIPGHADWWELTNLDAFPVRLNGFRFDDGSEMLAEAFAFETGAVIAPGESVIFVEEMTPPAFREWWGTDNLPENLTILTYSDQGRGLSSNGDAVNAWNAAAGEDFDKIASEVFSTATAGVSFGYNPDTGVFGELSVAGMFGAFAAATGGDVGSPGYVRNPPPRVRFTESARTDSGLRLTWTTPTAADYTLRFKNNLAEAAWTPLTTLTASGDTLTFEDAISGGAEQRFYQIVSGP